MWNSLVRGPAVLALCLLAPRATARQTAPAPPLEEGEDGVLGPANRVQISVFLLAGWSF